MLEYVPLFRGKVFVVLVEAKLLPEPAMAETLLDLAALQQIGVKLVLGVLDGRLDELYDWTVEGEMKVARVRAKIGNGQALDETQAVLERGQAAVIEAGDGGPLDASVVEFAAGLGAAKLIALLEEAILIDGSPVPAVSAAGVDDLLEQSKIHRADLLRAAAVGCSRGIPRVHVLSGRQAGVLVDELFSNEGVGTMVHADSYREIRPLVEEDIPELLGMIGRVVRRSRLVPRNYEDIARRSGDYRVMTIDGHVVGCVALHEYEDSERAEVACLYVKQAHEGLGHGADMVRHAEGMARERGFRGVFALTNRAADLFGGKLGFEEAGQDVLPAERRAMLGGSGRDSRVFVRDW